MTREFAHIELSGQDLLHLRDAVKPLSDCKPYDPACMLAFCRKVYYALLKQREEKRTYISMPLTVTDVMLLNHFLSTEDGLWALSLLEQTWHVLYELEHDQPYPRCFTEVETPWPVKHS